MWPGMMPILHSSGVMMPAGAGVAQGTLHLDHVEHRDALGDADRQRDAGVDRLEDRIRREGRRHVDGAGVRPGLADRLGDRVEDRQVEMSRAAFARRHAADHPGAVGQGLLRVEGPLRAGEALADDLGVLVDQNRHHAASFTALTTLSAASSKSSAD
jgi:hypothetical protein